MGFAAGAAGLGGLQQPVPGGGANGAPTATGASAPTTTAAPPADDPVAVLTRAKQMLDAGLITQEDYDAAKAKALGL
jgi:membrane protease subunit (stomatin/prohibitin family)